MRAFTHKPNAARQTTSAKSVMSVQAHFGHNHKLNSILHLQRMIGNQAMQLLLQADSEDPELESGSAAITGLAHSRTPIDEEGMVPGADPVIRQPAAVSWTPVIEGRSYLVQRVAWGSDEVRPMLPNEFRERVIATVEGLVSPSLRQGVVSRLFDPATGAAILVKILDDAVNRSPGLHYNGQLQLINDTANNLVRAFILDPNLSGLDLLTSAERTRYRNFRWDPDDFPNNGGPNDARARQMATALSAIRPERRVNQGSEAVVTEQEYTPRIGRFIRDHLQVISPFPVPAGAAQTPTQPAGCWLLDEARDAFERMRDAAWADGVALIVLEGYRSPEVARANAVAAQQPVAVAGYSSHILGLAVDLKMSFTFQGPSGPRDRNFAETTTRPMQDVVDMRRSPAHKWMFLRGADFGWYPYQNEPWHWEYNPPGLRTRFHQAVNAARP